MCNNLRGCGGVDGAKYAAEKVTIKDLFKKLEPGQV